MILVCLGFVSCLSRFVSSLSRVCLVFVSVCLEFVSVITRADTETLYFNGI